ncbi:DNA topoisomerase type I [Luteitalea pratensis]|uniref:DNA topoisomerase type I n=1 Tax=Luteitalea pratensis TaxID=1855912 RepID=A0A143PJS6_LUTPR|nr:DNA topoisomerase IB [Luteitalea pratensis]AMY08034.1 DNA topoisomerase type I [Luteitalea pratensis]
MAATASLPELPDRLVAQVAAEQPTRQDAAELANLRYVSDDEPGFSREIRGKRTIYRDPEGGVVRDAATLTRIRALVIPPAWTRVWICQRADGHVQATGRDHRGRKQYRYHPRWAQVRDAAKYGRLLAFGHALPVLRRRVMRDLQQPPLSRARVLATVIRLLETTLIRVGNEEYARTNQSFGLTTLRDRHVTVTADRLRFRFRAKSGVWQEITLQDGRLARTVKRCQDLPGQVLFQYLDGAGARQRVTSEDVNAYLRDVTGAEFTAKDFRTWAGTVLAAAALQELDVVDTAAGRKKNVARAIETVAKQLGNTRAVCRRCYVHPAVLEQYLDGATLDVLRDKAASMLMHRGRHLSREETAVLALLHRRMAAGTRGRQPRTRARTPRQRVPLRTRTA